MVKIGLLPLYIELYDEKVPELRPRLEKFYEYAAQKLEIEGFDVIRTPFCRIEPEFKEAVALFEQNGVQCIVTLHMAYSPSLESAAALAGTKLPIVVLDATDEWRFDASQNPDAISYCHGIHGVMDMCSLLNQNGKKFAIAAGHLDYSDCSDCSDVIRRAGGFVRAAVSAVSLAGSRVGSIGGMFEGMGDFAVTDKQMLDRFGVEIVNSNAENLFGLRKSLQDSEIEAEIDSDNKNSRRIGDFSREAHIQTARECMTVRKWLETEKLSAFSVNFLKIGAETGLSAMPFMEACKAMARGIGYAGEGDVLTAAFTGALLKGFPDTSFVEIFCPDWKGNTLFLSHMGEMNIRLTAQTPEIFEKEFIFGNNRDGRVINPVSYSGCYRNGRGVFVNVFRGQNDFKLLVSPAAMEAEPDSSDNPENSDNSENKSNFAGIIRGWMRPEKPVGEFLEDLSKAGATHHSIFVYGAYPEQIGFFGELLGLDVIEI